MTLPSFRAQFQALSGPGEQLRWLREQRLLGPSALLVERGLLPTDVGQLAVAWSEQYRAVSVGQLVEERRVLSGLVSADVPALALKGCLLGHAFYLSPDQRWRADLDVLVAPVSVDAARDVLRFLGYRPMWVVAGGTPMDQESWLLGEGPDRRVVDLHWDLRNHPVLRHRLGFEEQWEAAIELPSVAPGVRGQGAAHALLSAAMHWFDELFPGRKPLGWLLDMDLLWRSLDESGQTELVRLAVDRELAGLVAECLRLTRDVFETPIDGEVLQSLEDSGKDQRPTQLIKAGRSSYRALWFALRSEPGLAGKFHRLRH
jgi:GNAT superfamily N-acetyltransferase